MRISAGADERVIGDPHDWEAVLRFDPEFVDVVARRVIELTRQGGSPQDQTDSELLTVAEVAARLRVGPGWVYAHKHELGAIKLGDGPKARLRFDPSVVDARLATEQDRDPSQQATPQAATEPSKRRRRRLASRPLPTIDRVANRA